MQYEVKKLIDIKKEKLTTELYESPHRDKNEKKYGIVDTQCICCMKPIKGKYKTVNMNEDWVAVNNFVNDEDCKKLTGANSQGAFAIGNSCAKKMPKGFVSN